MSTLVVSKPITYVKRIVLDYGEDGQWKFLIKFNPSNVEDLDNVFHGKDLKQLQHLLTLELRNFRAKYNVNKFKQNEAKKIQQLEQSKVEKVGELELALKGA